MSRTDTALVATELHGNQLYHERARAALPILVRQAKAGVPITYERLAKELGMSNARNLNYPLGSIGNSLRELSRCWARDIPPIQCLVVNKNTGLPGPGIGAFFDIQKERLEALTKIQQRDLFLAATARVMSFYDWDKVLHAFSLKPLRYDVEDLIKAASTMKAAGEGEDHLRLKCWVRDHPEIFGIGGRAKAVVEQQLPSGDCLDVSFETDAVWVATEIKSAKSPPYDLIRGVFQVVKYKAVMSATAKLRGLQCETTAVLIHENTLAADLLAIAHTLGVECVGVERRGMDYRRIP